ncbi:MAG: alpha/beta hydrolase [Chloroflexi bacterium]|nr:alpha/beta hydrolase [Chloroflexota bacterium]MCL5074422.1 alpha/beta hydrolase [Chloroflexota bacterium]
MKIQQFWINSEGFNLEGRLFRPNQEQDQHIAIILLHGVKGIDYGTARRAEAFAQQGFTSLTFNFRGYGRSQGELDLAAMPADLAAALNLLYQEVAPEMPVALLGLSFGVIPAIWVGVHDRRVKAIVGWRAIGDIEAWYNLIRRPIRRLGIEQLRFQNRHQAKGFYTHFWPSLRSLLPLNPLTVVEQLSPTPLYLVHAVNDFLMPAQLAKNLYKRAKEPKRLVLLDTSDHAFIQPANEQKVIALAVDWLKEALTV